MSIPLSELLGSHSVEEVKGWVESLRYFAFTAAYSGDHVSSSEELVVYVSFSGKDDLMLVLGKLGILSRGDGTEPSPIATPGQPRNVFAFPDILDPEGCEIAGVACNVRVLSSSLCVAVAEAGGGVNAERVADAQTIEAKLDQLGFGSRLSKLDYDFVIGRDRF